MKKILLLLLTLWVANSNAQVCGGVFQDDGATSRDPLCDLYATNTQSYCMKVKFHIVRDDNQANGFNYTQLSTVLNAANNYLGAQGITMVSLGYDYINSTTYNSLDSTELAALGAINNAAGQVDFYLVNQIAGSVIGYAYAGNVFVENAYGATSVSAHEIAHVFGLAHVDNGGPACPGGENGSNCQTCLDNVCDTYASNSSNVMYSSYIPPQTPFTAGQGTRMRNYINCYYSSIRSNLCATLTGVNRMCATATQTYNLQGQIPGATVIWTVTPNLQILSSTSTSVTVQGINSSANGMATITANIGGTLITKNIFVGKPLYNVVRDVVEYCDNNWHYLVIEIVHADTTVPTSGYTYSFNTPPGITYTALGNNKFRFRLAKTYVGYFELLATVTNACGSTQNYSEQDVKLCGTFTYQYKGVSGDEETQVAKSNGTLYKVYPNPSSHIVNIELRDANMVFETSAKIKAELFDAFGQQMRVVEIVTNRAAIDISGLKQGIYILKVNIDGQIETHQVIVK